jgi:uncharacterized protein
VRRRRALFATACLIALAAPLAGRADALAPIPPLRGPVVDLAGLLSPAQSAFLDALARELQSKTGAQTAVLCVETTDPEDIFDYGMRVAEAWQLGRRGRDDGLLLVVARRDRKLRFFTGYGLEAVLPDGKLGRILDAYALPYFRRGEFGDGIVTSMHVASLAIASAAGVELRGAPAPAARPGRPPAPGWPFVVGLVILLLLLRWAAPPGARRRRRYHPVFWGGGLGSGGFGGGFRGGGGFGGGGGGFGGGGAGRGW